MPAPSRATDAKQSQKDQTRSTDTALLNKESTPSFSAQHSLLSIHRSIGNRAFGQALQAKLAISSPGDAYEQEADRVAEQVASSPTRAAVSSSPPLIQLQRKCSECEKEEKTRHRMTTTARNRSVGQILQAKQEISSPSDVYEQEADRVAKQVMHYPQWSLSGGVKETSASLSIQRTVSGLSPGISEAPPSVHAVLSSPGQPLPLALQEEMGRQFNHDFSLVRVHTDAKAAESSQVVNALAYTVGNHVVFGSGQYQPHTSAGRRLLAHELTHTVQQAGFTAPSYGSIRIGPLSDVYERQADSATTQAGARNFNSLPAPRLQRAPAPVTAADDFSTITARLEQIIRTGGPLPTDTRVIGAAIVEVEGYTGPLEFRATSGAATDVLGAGAPVEHATSPATRTLSATRSIAGAGARREFPFSHINDAEMKLFEEIKLRLPPNAQGRIHILTLRSRQGGTVLEPIPACSGCTRASFEVVGGLEKLTLINHSATHPPMGTLDFADEPGKQGGGKQGAGGEGEAPMVETTQVGTEIKVINSVKNADGSIVAEVEYSFGEDLAKINQSLPEGSKLPARIVMRVSQNADGAITAVESLSGQPKALVEALARQTLSSSTVGGAGEGTTTVGKGAAEGAASEGAAVSGRGMIRLAKGLKIGGWIAFAVITGYELYTATPAERPKVLVKAGGGLAGGAVGSYLVCNAALGLETVGWSLLICAFVAGGAGAYAGSAIAGAAYGDVPGSPLHEALKTLDYEPPNVRVLFNIVMENKNPSFLPADGDFVHRYLAAVPSDLKDYEVVILASQLANLQHIYIAPDYSGMLSTGPESICPNCHQTYREQKEKQEQRNQETQERRRQEAVLEEDRQNRENRLRLLKSAILNLTERRSTGDKAHRPSPTPLTSVVSPRPDVHAPANVIPPVSQQRGTVCPNCHGSTGENRSLADRFGGFGRGRGGQMTNEDMKRLKDFINAQK